MGTDRENEEAIVGLSEGFERVLVMVPLGEMCWSWESGSLDLASLRRAGHYLHSRIKSRVTGHRPQATGHRPQAHRRWFRWCSWVVILPYIRRGLSDRADIVNNLTNLAASSTACPA